MRIVSLVNSGESLEKTVALIMTAYESNLHFYSSFDEVLVFYSNNIKKSKNDDYKLCIERERELAFKRLYNTL